MADLFWVKMKNVKQSQKGEKPAGQGNKTWPSLNSRSPDPLLYCIHPSTLVAEATTLSSFSRGLHVKELLIKEVDNITSVSGAIGLSLYVYKNCFDFWNPPLL